MLARWASRAKRANRVGRTATVLIALIVIATTSFAQRYRLPEGPNVPARYRPPEFNDGGVHALQDDVHAACAARPTAWAGPPTIPMPASTC